ncbi:ribosome maturation factor RimP [Thiohalomonas denitrificans]|uniref:ribosome maturation factor RimP n=1 Tax=Thiohalomonas denitrificans TaxID=415747 RepID=UPI0026EE79D7|nr:ribosome maturation factor RimP [Thiohalomonas denitrificans]
MDQMSQRLDELLEPSVAVLGYELVGVEYLAQGLHSLLRVYIDSEDGITVDDCARVSRQISAVLDVEDPIRGQYTLEVSSPGADRPLFKAKDYERFAGNRVKLKLKVPLEGRRNFKGHLIGINGTEVTLESEDREWLFALQDIEKAQLVPEW